MSTCRSRSWAEELRGRHLPEHVFKHLLTMGHLHAANAYDRLSPDVENILRDRRNPWKPRWSQQSRDVRRGYFQWTGVGNPARRVRDWPPYRFASPSRFKSDYTSTFLLTTYRVYDTRFASWLRGAFSRNDPARRSRSGVPRCGANRNAGRSGPRPPGVTAWRGQSLRLRFHCREPASWVRIRKPPRWSAERGPGRPGTGWSRVAGATERKSAPVGAPSPLIGGTELLLSRRPLAPKPRGLAGGRESEGTCEETDKPGRSNAPRERTTLRCLTS
jgi:hypothetical protein